jgi:hypothetical protein
MVKDGRSYQCLPTIICCMRSKSWATVASKKWTENTEFRKLGDHIADSRMSHRRIIRSKMRKKTPEL